MKKEKGILGRLLITVGAVLVAVGVFVFQGISSAEDSGMPADNGVGVNIPSVASENTDNENINDNNDNADSGDNEESNNDSGEELNNSNDDTPEVFSFVINYYTEKEETDPETGEVKTVLEEVDKQDYNGIVPEYTFEVIDREMEGQGDFLGWYEYENEKEGEYYKAGDEIILNTEKAELKLVAKFAVLETYALRYNANGGIGAPGTQACQAYFGTCDFTISGAIPTREGYEFKGWAVDGDTSKMYAPSSVVKSLSADEPLTLYAIWAEIKTYTLMYDVNGGSGAPEVQACKSANGSCKFIVSAVVPTKNKSSFVGWRRGDETFTADMEITVTESNTILLAEWNSIYTFNLTYVSEKDTENLPDAAKCETAMGTCTFIVSDKEPVREGYKFLGWRFEDKEDMLAKAGDELVVSTNGELDLKIHAVWSRIYTILNSGEVFGAGERVVLRSSASYGDFQKLIIDSVEVPAEYYVLSEGETTSVILSNAFSQSLSSGEHGFEITWADGDANGLISVNQNEDGTKRFVVVDGSGTTDGAGLMYRPKAGAVSKESSGVTDSATNNEESGFDAVRTLIFVAIAAFAIIYIVNRIYVHHKLGFIEEL